MGKTVVMVVGLATALAGGFVLGRRDTPAASASSASSGPADVSVAAVPGQTGGQDLFGAYDAVPDWPQPLTELSDHGKWTYSAFESVYAESPNLDGHYLYSWGVWGDFPGGLWGVHGFSVDQEGNVYTAEVDNGRVQKYRSRPGANAAMLVGKPVYAAWK